MNLTTLSILTTASVMKRTRGTNSACSYSNLEIVPVLTLSSMRLVKTKHQNDLSRYRPGKLVAIIIVTICNQCLVKACEVTGEISILEYFTNVT